MGTIDSTQPTSTPVWRTLESPEQITEAILGLYRRRGLNRYDEIVNQNEHALQCATLALRAGGSPNLVVAALLHDIGHLIDSRDTSAAAALGIDHRHEEIGARFCANWFPASVTEPMRLHVSAKRYLCAVDADYFDQLSPASVRSLELQGGPFSTAASRLFLDQPFAAEAIALRRFDEQAKDPEAQTHSFELFGAIMLEVLR